MTTSTYLPTTFADAIACVQQFALQVFDRQIGKKQLYYHNREHIQQDNFSLEVTPFKRMLGDHGRGGLGEKQ